jgi:hypothetical protein
MNLIILWLTFILIPGLFPDIDASHYLLFSGTMFYLTYIYNQINPLILTPRISVLFLNIPSSILWYVAYHYNDFLCINPISKEFFVSLMFIYWYVMIYVASEWH